ncbi:MAG: TIGR02147 family protein [Proteobacteria bacterium]|nr:MAG: TIGR02147 family protein [Pseudomonadota bacterium]
MHNEAAKQTLNPPLSRTALSADERTSFRLWLQREFTERCKRNARFSLRAFAKMLDLDPSSLSQILSGKRPVSRKSVKTIAERLGAKPQTMKAFGFGSSSAAAAVDYHQLAADTFAVISDWYHYAILELTFVSGFKAEPKWIARKLSITVQEAKSAVERLLRLELLIEENGSLLKSAKHLTNQSNVDTSHAHRELQRQIIEKALAAIEEAKPEEKDITSMTMAIDERNLPKARELTRKYRRELCALLEDGEQSRVYHLAIQLYPVSKEALEESK